MTEETLPTLTDVAHAAGVSLSTASRALSVSRDRVSAGLRERVIDAASQLNYVPNAHARALVSASSSTVGLVVHDVSDPYFSEIARGVLKVATEHGLLVMICNTYRDPERELMYIEALRSQRVAAIVLAGSGYEDRSAERRLDASLLAFAETGGRVALLGRHRLKADAVLPENVAGAKAMAAALADLGHRRIGVIAGPGGLTTVADRLRGAREALAAADLQLPDAYVLHADFTRSGGHHGTLQLMRQAPELTAIFALNDAMAIGALAALRERDVAVPEYMSVVGFDDIGGAVDVTPALSTVRLPMEEMGADALRLALKTPAKSRRRRRVRAEVILRDSTSPPRE